MGVGGALTCWSTVCMRTDLLERCELNTRGGGGMGLLSGSLSAEEMYMSRSWISSRSRFTHSCFVSSDDACNTARA